ncbi:MAG: hypothetical protein RIS70_936, partial [Planctomycetota bacterium]
PEPSTDDKPASASGSSDSQPEPKGDDAAGSVDPEPKGLSQPQAPPQPNIVKSNRLAKEASPYLLLHAHNPVDWYPWGEEALSKAKQEKKPIFLSIGYSSCHWCHVMERESFLDEEIAAFLNQHFICIKVDREERPEIDTIYMTALRVYNQLTRSGRGGGWPLSMFLTSDAEPFFGGTYFPARDGDRGASAGFLTLIQKIAEVWSSDSEKIIEDAKTLTKYVKVELENQRPVLAAQLEKSMLDGLQAALSDEFDATHGGFGYVASNPQRPKFPEPSNLLFLLHRIERARASGESEEPAMTQLTTTLDHMAMGGIRDHLGGGFHRYSVDRYWQIPHFEKMLYDNGQLATVYAEASQLLDREDYRQIAREMCDFVLAELTDTEGGFYSALDAESEHEEGKYYRWTREELDAFKDDPQWAEFATIYGLSQEPNFETEFFVPQLATPLLRTAESQQTSFAQLHQRMAGIRSSMLQVRSQRERPLTDTKILTAWNGLMIRGMADTGRILNEPKYVESAARAADFILAKLQTADGRLLRTFGQGEGRLNAYISDYAFFVDGCLALHRATKDERWLKQAERLTEKQLELFWDERAGGFFFTTHDHESLLARTKELSDSAEPAGNSVAAENLLSLADALNRPEYRKKAELTILAAARLLSDAPSAVPRLSVALARFLETSPTE